jgi:hypothetical protein
MLMHNLKIEILNNDTSIKLTQLLNDLNIKFTVDNLSKVLEIMFTLYIEQLEVDKVIKLIEKLGYTDIFENQDISNIIKTLEKLIVTITDNQDINLILSVVDKLKYQDILDMIYEASMKLYEKIKVEMIHEDFNLSIQGGLNINAMRQMIDLKSLTMGSLKTMTLWNFYFVDN